MDIVQRQDSKKLKMLFGYTNLDLSKAAMDQRVFWSAPLSQARQMEGVATPVLHLPQQIPEHLHEKLIRLFKALIQREVS
eukprot:5736257-Amphidinium_carterae.1